MEQQTAATSLPPGTLSGEGFIGTLGPLCTLHGVPFDPALFLGQFLSPGTVEKLLAVLGALGFQTGQTQAQVIQLKGKVIMLFIAHQLPRGLQVDEVVRLSPCVAGEIQTSGV